MKRPNQANILLEKHLTELGLDYVTEYRFCERRWRFDYLLCPGPPEHGAIAIEIEGGIYARGRHTRGQGYENDMRKYNTATLAGYRVLRFSTGQVLSGEAKAFLKEHLV